MNAPHAVTTVVINENLKKIVKPKERQRQFLSYFFCAAVAGSVASIVTIPLDNIKTKLQTQSTDSYCEKCEETKINKCGSDNIIKYRDIPSTIKILYNEQGIKNGFFRGILPRVMFHAPSCAISWGSYEFLKSLLIKISDRK